MFGVDMPNLCPPSCQFVPLSLQQFPARLANKENAILIFSLAAKPMGKMNKHKPLGDYKCEIFTRECYAKNWRRFGLLVKTSQICTFTRFSLASVKSAIVPWSSHGILQLLTPVMGKNSMGEPCEATYQNSLVHCPLINPHVVSKLQIPLFL